MPEVIPPCLEVLIGELRDADVLIEEIYAPVADTVDIAQGGGRIVNPARIDRQSGGPRQHRLGATKALTNFP